MYRIDFNRDKYIQLQSQHIAECRTQFDGKLYLEFDGKPIDDMHVAQVPPGLAPGNKLAILREFAEDVEIVVVVNARDFRRHKTCADLDTAYEGEVLRQIDAFDGYGLYIGLVATTQWADDNRKAKAVERRFERLGVRVYRHFPVPGYPNDIAHIVSNQGLGHNDYMETSHDLVVVAALGPRSGKMAICLSQLYHDRKWGISPGYAKWEIFLIWNLPIDHPVNVAYEAVTVDLNDVNMIGLLHLAAHGVQTVSHSHGVEIFPALSRLFTQILGEPPCQNPTDMGVNMVGLSIHGDKTCQDASKQEATRRYCEALVTGKKELVKPLQLGRITLPMSKFSITGGDRPIVTPCRKMAKMMKVPAATIGLADGRIILGKTSPLLGCSSAMLLNVLKTLAGVDPKIDLLAGEATEPIQYLKIGHLDSRNPRPHTDEVPIAFTISVSTDEDARVASDRLGKFKGCDAYAFTILGSTDKRIFRSLDIQVANELVYATKSLHWKKRCFRQCDTP